MNAQEHLDVARQFREISRQLARRNQTAAGEMLWGVAHRIIQAINIQYGIIPAGRPLRRGTVVRHLDTQHLTTPRLEDGLGAVGRLHGHFYNSNLTEERLAVNIQEAETFISDLINLPETLAIAPA